MQPRGPLIYRRLSMLPDGVKIRENMSLEDRPHLADMKGLRRNRLSSNSFRIRRVGSNVIGIHGLDFLYSVLRKPGEMSGDCS